MAINVLEHSMTYDTDYPCQDDFMALLLKGGNPVLVINLGDGTEEIRHDRYVADNQWHQIIIDR